MDNVNYKFDEEFIDSWWQRVKFWFFYRKVRAQKVQALWESNIDKMFFETTQKEWLNYNDTKDRASLSAENKKPLAEQNQAVIAELEDRISTAKAVKNAYYKNEKFHNEIRTYILMLDQWNKLQKPEQNPD